jgi:hypothetical protein
MNESEFCFLRIPNENVTALQNADNATLINARIKIKTISDILKINFFNWVEIFPSNDSIRTKSYLND